MMSFKSKNFFNCHYSIQSILLIGLLFSCFSSFSQPKETGKVIIPKDAVYLKILGIAQDGGYPQIGCIKACCNAIKQGKETKKNVVGKENRPKRISMKFQLFDNFCLIMASP